MRRTQRSLMERLVRAMTKRDASAARLGARPRMVLTPGRRIGTTSVLVSAAGYRPVPLLLDAGSHLVTRLVRIARAGRWLVSWPTEFHRELLP